MAASELFETAAFVVTAVIVLLYVCLCPFSLAVSVQEPQQSVEEVLPAGPVLRVFGSYLASLLFLIALLLLGVLSMLHYQPNNGEIETKALLNWVLPGIVCAHSLLLALAYWTRRALLGLALGLIPLMTQFVVLKVLAEQIDTRPTSAVFLAVMANIMILLLLART